MEITILLFATLKDRVGSGQIPLQLRGDRATITDVRRTLMAEYPALEPHLPTAIAAINEEFAYAEDMVQPGDRVAFFPPVSGGSGETYPLHPEVFRLADAPFSTDELVALITTPATGAACVFSGMVRGATVGKSTTEFLEYEAYSPMAIAKMQQVAAEIRQQWPLVQGIAIVQRVGRLEVGQNTIVIACSSGHRDQGCFEAARYGIDRLKEIVPVWKKEFRPDGSSWLEGQYTPQQGD